MLPRRCLESPTVGLKPFQELLESLELTESVPPRLTPKLCFLVYERTENPSLLKILTKVASTGKIGPQPIPLTARNKDTRKGNMNDGAANVAVHSTSSHQLNDLGGIPEVDGNCEWRRLAVGLLGRVPKDLFSHFSAATCYNGAPPSLVEKHDNSKSEQTNAAFSIHLPDWKIA